MISATVNSRYLLDVNVLIALFDPAHIFHEQAHDWFQRKGAAHWASCPITENGFVRVVSNPRYPSTALTPLEAITRLLNFKAGSPGYLFWPDEISITDAELFSPDLITQSKELTDIYLMGLTAKRKGRLATFDRRLRPNIVRSAAKNLIELIPS